MSVHELFLRLRKTLGLLVVGSAAWFSPSPSGAATINVGVAFDLNNSTIGPGSNGFLMGWGMPFTYFPAVSPVSGDTLDITVDFVDSVTGNPQELTVTDLGSGVGQGIFATLDAGGGNVTADANNAFTFTGVTGNLLTNPVLGSSHSSGSGVGSTIITNLSNEPLTNTSFAFTGITWAIGFTQLTYNTGSSFNSVTINLGADQISIAPVPLPAAAWLLLSALGGFGAIARGHREAAT
jgi:hypothetical protein